MSTEDLLHALATRASQSIDNDGALRSALRRAVESNDVIGLEAAHAFASSLRRIKGHERVSEAVADGAFVLMAQRNVLRFHELGKGPVPARGQLEQKLGEKVGERRRLSELRFQRLLRTVDSEDRLQQMRRAIALPETRIHPLAVLRAWLDLHSESGRRRFAQAYFTGLSMPATAADATRNASV